MTSRLRLPEFDQLPLGHLDDRNWVRPYDVLVSVISKSRARRTLLCFGDQLFSQRFSAWVCHQPDEPSMVSQPLSGGVNALTSEVRP